MQKALRKQITICQFRRPVLSGLQQIQKEIDMTRPSHHPWMNSAKFIRNLAMSRISNANAARIRGNIAEAIHVDDHWLACILSIRFQEEKGEVEKTSCPEINGIPDLQFYRNVALKCGIDIVRKDVSAHIVDTVFKVIEDSRNFKPVKATEQIRSEPVSPTIYPAISPDENYDMQDPRDDVPQSDVMPVM